MKGSKGNDGHHHQIATRTQRNRDGTYWDPTGGQMVTDAQRKGYSGGESVGKPVTSGAMRGPHTSKKSGGGKGKYPM